MPEKNIPELLEREKGLFTNPNSKNELNGLLLGVGDVMEIIRGVIREVRGDIPKIIKTLVDKFGTQLEIYRSLIHNFSENDFNIIVEYKYRESAIRDSINLILNLKTRQSRLIKPILDLLNLKLIETVNYKNQLCVQKYSSHEYVNTERTECKNCGLII